MTVIVDFRALSGARKKKIAQYNSVEPAFIHFCLVWNIHLDKFCRLEDLKPFIGAELK